MKVAFTSQPGRGHVNGLVALAQEFLRLGHDVVGLGAPSVAQVFRAAGLPALQMVPEPPGSDSAFVHHHVSSLESTPRADWLPIIRREVSVRMRARQLAGALLESPALEGVDLLVHDATELAGWVIAERKGIPNVPFEVSAHWSEREWNTHCAREISDLRASIGLASDESSPAAAMYRYGLLANSPPSFDEGATAAGARFVTPIFFDGAVVIPTTSRAPIRGPHLYAAFGSVYGPDKSVYEAVVSSLAETWPVNAVGLAGLATSRVATFDYLSQAADMDGCLAVVCHGGRSTVLTALRYAIPVVCVPLASDNFVVAQTVVRLEVGIEVPWVAETIARSTAFLIANFDVRESVAGFASEISEMPSLEAAWSVPAFVDSRLSREFVNISES